MADHTILIINVLIILSVIVCAILVLLLYGVSGKAKKRKLNYLKENGEIIEAEITDFRFEWSFMNAQLLRIIARTFMYGVAQEFISEKISISEKIYIYSDKCNLKEGDKVRILVNMKNPKQYYFDPYQKEY